MHCNTRNRSHPRESVFPMFILVATAIVVAVLVVGLGLYFRGGQ